MKKHLLAIAITAGLVSSFAANADAKFYGNVHVSIDSQDSKDNLDMNSNTSSVGFKGKEDLGGGMSALFKVEFQVDPTERNKASVAAQDAGAATVAQKKGTGIVDRDQWVGLKGGMGTVKFGTMSNNYKQMGGKIDPMYRTKMEGRGLLGTQSGLHGGAGIDGGRSTNTLQYSSPKMGGMQMVFNTTISNADDETIGLGLRYKTKKILAYFDFLDSGPKGESAMKFGGTYKMDAIKIGFQYEAAEDLVGSDIMFLSANYKLNSNDNVAVSLGDVDKADTGFAFMYNHKLSKKTNTYVGYADSAVSDDNILSLGVRHKF